MHSKQSNQLHGSSKESRISLDERQPQGTSDFSENCMKKKKIVPIGVGTHPKLSYVDH